MTEQQAKELFNRPAIKKRNANNPDIYSTGEVAMPKQESRGALDKRTPTPQGRSRRVEGCKQLVRIYLISLRRRLIEDSDNFAVGFKGLRDSIANSLEIDDRDANIDWQYGQLQYRGTPHTLVTMELIQQ